MRYPTLPECFFKFGHHSLEQEEPPQIPGLVSERSAKRPATRSWLRSRAASTSIFPAHR